MSRRLWPHAWAVLLTAFGFAFAVLEYEAYRYAKHPTLSRCLARWLSRLGQAGPYLLALAGAGLAVHVARIEAER